MKILISACLLGERVRYDGRDCATRHPAISSWQESGVLLPFCPECAAGLPVPRKPAEIVQGEGRDVLLGAANVITVDGVDVTEAYLAGAQAALQMARKNRIRMAVLKERSPSCGSQSLYDGSFSGRMRAGAGVTSRLLQQHGIQVFSEQELDQAWAFWVDQTDY